MENISVYICKVCDSHFGLFFNWDEIDNEINVSSCCACGSKDIQFVRDRELKY